MRGTFRRRLLLRLADGAIVASLPLRGADGASRPELLCQAAEPGRCYVSKSGPAERQGGVPGALPFVPVDQQYLHNDRGSENQQRCVPSTWMLLGIAAERMTMALRMAPFLDEAAKEPLVPFSVRQPLRLQSGSRLTGWLSASGAAEDDAGCCTGCWW
jgi:hypothetical protein